MTQPGLSKPRPESDDEPVAVVYYHLGINDGMGAQYAETARLTREAAMAVAAVPRS